MSGFLEVDNDFNHYDSFENVIKRDGTLEKIDYNKIEQRLQKLGDEVGLKINYSQLVRNVCAGIKDKITTTEIDRYAAVYCDSLFSKHIDYYTLAGRILVSNHQKNTKSSFTEVMNDIYNGTNLNGNQPLIDKKMIDLLNKHGTEIDKMINYERDYLIDYFGFITLENGYLISLGEKVVERIQHMWMRVSIGIHWNNLERVKETYELMSQKYFIHATPTLFNSGTKNSQLSSCFLLQAESDSIDGIFNSLHECAKISQYAGGIGINIHNIRAKGTRIAGTNGTSNGIVPMLRVFNNTARYVDQGGGKRKGSIAVYLEPWHADIMEFLQLKLNTGIEESRARDLFYALWIPDLFMKRVRENKKWSLLCPHKCPGLSDVYGEEFETLYEKYESNPENVNNVIDAQDVWLAILKSQMETGTPYMCYKDAMNRSSNQKNIGIIKSSNLCTEIALVSSDTETAVCNLASLSLPAFVDVKTKTFDYEKLHAVTKIVATNIDSIIDVNFYPSEKAKRSNLLHRPIGIGIQGLANVFFKMDLVFESPEALEVNRLISETMYHAAIERSCELAKERYEKLKDNWYSSAICEKLSSNPFAEKSSYIDEQNRVIYDEVRKLSVQYCGAYSSFVDSPMYNGQFQFNMQNKKPTEGRYDWELLRNNVKMYGIRNSTSIALMPTASTSQILGNNECFEGVTYNIYVRKTKAGEFTVINTDMIKDLMKVGLWNEEVKNSIISHRGSVQHLSGVTQHFKDKFKTVYEMKQRHILDMAIARTPFVCQAQSSNAYFNDVTTEKLSAYHYYGWINGLKTGLYYLHTRSATQAQQFTIAPELKKKSKYSEPENHEETGCLMCSA